MASVLSHCFRRYISLAAVRGANLGSAATAGEHSGGYKTWRRLSFFVALPAVGLCMLNAYLKHQEEHAHGHVRPEFKKYEYMRVRTKRFPWGDGQRSLFHNPHVNALPDGYEEDH